jgi:hypothetical protein
MASSGKVGFLFVVRDGKAAVAAPEHGSPPPALVRRVDELLEESSSVASSTYREDDGDDWHLMLLVASVGSRERVVGAIAIQAGSSRFHMPDRRLVRQLALELYEAGDATAILAHPPQMDEQTS